MNYKELIPKLIERDDPYSVTDAFDLCRELEQEGSVFVEITAVWSMMRRISHSHTNLSKGCGQLPIR